MSLLFRIHGHGLSAFYKPKCLVEKYLRSEAGLFLKVGIFKALIFWSKH